jgi:hypothetical protein
MPYYLTNAVNDSLPIRAITPEINFSADLRVKASNFLCHSVIKQLRSFWLIYCINLMSFPPQPEGRLDLKPHSKNCAAFFILFSLIVFLYNCLDLILINSNPFLSIVTYVSGRHNLSSFNTAQGIHRFFQYEEEKDE